MRKAFLSLAVALSLSCGVALASNEAVDMLSESRLDSYVFDGNKTDIESEDEMGAALQQEAAVCPPPKIWFCVHIGGYIFCYCV